MTQNETPLAPPAEQRFRVGDIVKLRNGQIEVVRHIAPTLYALFPINGLWTLEGHRFPGIEHREDIVEVLSNISDAERVKKLEQENDLLRRQRDSLKNELEKQVSMMGKMPLRRSHE